MINSIQYKNSKKIFVHIQIRIFFLKRLLWVRIPKSIIKVKLENGFTENGFVHFREDFENFILELCFLTTKYALCLFFLQVQSKSQKLELLIQLKY